MIKVVAIEPELMGNPDFRREYLKDFGAARGRWIPLYPHDWRSKVISILKRLYAPKKRTEIRDKLFNPKFKDRYVKLPKHLRDITHEAWKDGVLQYCTDGLFTCAIVHDCDDDDAFLLKAGAFDPDDNRYVPVTSGLTKRTPQELFEPLKPILLFAGEVHVIDKYCHSCGTNTQGYKNFISSILEYLRSANPSVKLINLYRARESDYDKTNEMANYKSWIDPILEEGESIVIHYLKERAEGEKIHMRAVFTDIALTSGHYGYGEGQGEQETTDFSIREYRDLITIREQYTSETKRAFDLDPIEIITISKSVSD